MNCVGLSQSIDTTCVPTAKLKAVITEAKQAPILRERINLLTDDIRLLNQRIALKDSIISNLDKKSENYEAIFRATDDQKRVLKEQIELMENQVHTLESMYRKERRKRTWTAIGGTLTTAAALYLFATK